MVERRKHVSEIVHTLEVLRGKARERAFAEWVSGGVEASAWRHLLCARDVKLRRTVAEYLSEETPTGAQEALIVALDDPDRRVRDAAFVGLARLEPPAEVVVDELARHLDVDVAFDMMSGYGEAALEALSGALMDRDATRRERAATLLGRLGTPAACERLLVGIDDPESQVQQAVLAALSSLPPTEEAADLLVEHVRDDAARGLMLSYGEVAQSALERGLAHRDPKVRKASVSTLAELGRDASLPVTAAIAGVLDDPSRSVRRVALAELSTLPADPSVPARLARVLTEDAAQGLFEGYGDAVVPALLPVLLQGTPKERDVASELLLQTPGVNRVELASRLVDHLDSKDVVSVLDALGADASASVFAVLEGLEGSALRAALGLLASHPVEPERMAQALAKHIEDKTAMGMLAELGDAAIPALEDVLAGEDDSTKRRALSLLGELGVGQAAVPTLLDALGEASSRKAQSAAISALEQVDALDSESLSRLARQLDVTGVSDLLVTHGGDGLAAVLGQVSDADADQRKLAIKALSDFGPLVLERGQAVLLERLEREEDRGVQRELFKLLEGLERAPELASGLARHVTDKRVRAMLVELEGAAVPALIEQLEHEDASHRKAAIQCLTMLDPEHARGATAALTAALDDESSAVHRAALGALEALGAEGEEVVVALARHIHSSGALEQLLAQGANAVPALVSLLDADDPKTRKAALESLASLEVDASEALGAVTVALDDLERSVRRAALGAVEALSPSPERLVDLLIPRLDDKLAREQLVEQGEAAVEALVEVLSHDDPNLRKVALEAIASLEGTAASALPAVIERLEDEDNKVVRAAFKALESLPHDAELMVPALLPHIGRKEARALLVAQGGAATPSVLELLEDESHRTRLLAVDMLDDLGTRAKATATALESVLSDSNGRVRKAAMGLLSKIDPESEALPEIAARQLPSEDAIAILERAGASALPHLITALSQKRARLAAVQLIAKLGEDAGTAASHALKEHVHDRSSEVRLATLEALLTIHAQRRKQLKPILFAALDDDSIAVEELAREALEDLGVSVPKTNWETCPLSSKVISELRRLGVSYHPLDEPEPREMNGHPVPEPMRTLFDDMAWPPRSFRSRKKSKKSHRDLVFGLIEWLDPEEYLISDRKGRPLVLFGHGNEGQDLLLTALDVATPEDPLVYVIDGTQEVQKLGRGTRLSTLLSDLQPE